MDEHPRIVTGRDRRWRGAVLTAVVLAVLAVGLRGCELPSLGNPFGSSTVDRSSPALSASSTSRQSSR